MVFSGLFLEDIGINNLILIHVNYWNFKKSEIFKNSSYAVHMVSFENFVKLVLPSLSELKVTPIFCFAFKIPDDVSASRLFIHDPNNAMLFSWFLRIICISYPTTMFLMTGDVCCS